MIWSVVLVIWQRRVWPAMHSLGLRLPSLQVISIRMISPHVFMFKSVDHSILLAFLPITVEDYTAVSLLVPTFLVGLCWFFVPPSPITLTVIISLLAISKSILPLWVALICKYVGSSEVMTSPTVASCFLIFLIWKGALLYVKSALKVFFICMSFLII